MKLVVLAGAKQGTEIPLKKDKFVIGRSKDCTLRAGSEAISRHHCVILRSDNGVSIRDLGSRNGTYVNGEKIEGESPLEDGHTVRVGSLELRFEASHDLARSKKPKVKDVADAVSRTAEGPDSDATTEDDISRWLLGPDLGSSASMQETQSFKLDETRTLEHIEPVQPEPSQADSDETTVVNESDADDKKKGKKANKKSYGKLPPLPPKHSAKDSREAAADVLREMTRRR